MEKDRKIQVFVVNNDSRMDEEVREILLGGRLIILRTHSSVLNLKKEEYR